MEDGSREEANRELASPGAEAGRKLASSDGGRRLAG